MRRCAQNDWKRSDDRAGTLAGLLGAAAEVALQKSSNEKSG